jgi:hypothetical protein
MVWIQFLKHSSPVIAEAAAATAEAALAPHELQQHHSTASAAALQQWQHCSSTSPSLQYCNSTAVVSKQLQHCSTTAATQHQLQCHSSTAASVTTSAALQQQQAKVRLSTAWIYILQKCIWGKEGPAKLYEIHAHVKDKKLLILLRY